MKQKRQPHPINGFIFGSALILVGTIATLASYTMAANGSRYSIWYGAAALGIVRVIVSIVQVAKRESTVAAADSAPAPKKSTTAELPASYYDQYFAATATAPTGPVGPRYVLPSMQRDRNTPILLGLIAIAALLIAIAGASFYTVLTGGNLFTSVSQVTGLNRVTPPDAAHTNTAAMTGPAYVGTGGGFMPAGLAIKGYTNMGNGIAMQAEDPNNGGCMLYDGCFRYDYTQFSDVCTHGIAVTFEGFAGEKDLGPTTLKAGPMQFLLNQTGAIEFEGNFNGQYADGVQLVSATCA